MAGYLSPATFQTPNEWKARGPLGGFLAGMNQDIGNQIVGREFQNDDLHRQIQELRLKEEQDTMGAKLAQAALVEAQSKADKERIDSGIYAQVKASDDAARLSKNETAMVSDVDEVRKMVAPIWVQMGQELEQMGGQLNPMNQNHQEWYKGYVDQMAKYKVKMPDWPDQSDMVKLKAGVTKAQEYLATKSHGALNTADVVNKRSIKSAEDASDYRKAVDVAKIGAESREDVAGIRAASAKEVADIRTQLQQATRTREAMANAVIIGAAKNGGEITADVKAAADVLAERDFKDVMQLDTNFKMQLLTAGPEQAESMKEAKKNQLAQKYLAMASGKQGGGGLKQTVMGPTPKPQAGGIEAQVKASGIPYEPDKYEYRVMDGKVQRKPKAK